MTAKILPPIKFDKNNYTMDEYVALQSNSGGGNRHSPFADRMKNSITKYKNYIYGRVLDIGCGEGTALEMIKDIGHSCEGYDISERKAIVAREHGLKVTVGHQEKLPFKDKEFDTIFSSHVLEHSYDRKAAAKEHARVAKRGVIIVPTEPDKQGLEHLGAFKNAVEFKKLFEDLGHIVAEEALYRMQSEYTIIIDFYETKN